MHTLTHINQLHPLTHTHYNKTKNGLNRRSSFVLNREVERAPPHTGTKRLNQYQKLTAAIKQ